MFHLPRDGEILESLERRRPAASTDFFRTAIADAPDVAAVAAADTTSTDGRERPEHTGKRLRGGIFTVHLMAAHDGLLASEGLASTEKPRTHADAFSN